MNGTYAKLLRRKSWSGQRKCTHRPVVSARWCKLYWFGITWNNILNVRCEIVRPLGLQGFASSVSRLYSMSSWRRRSAHLSARREKQQIAPSVRNFEDWAAPHKWDSKRAIRKYPKTKEEKEEEGENGGNAKLETTVSHLLFDSVWKCLRLKMCFSLGEYTQSHKSRFKDLRKIRIEQLGELYNVAKNLSLLRFSRKPDDSETRVLCLFQWTMVSKNHRFTDSSHNYAAVAVHPSFTTTN